LQTDWIPWRTRAQPADYFFLPADCFDATALFFFWSALLALDFFCVVFFWFDFGDLSPIIMLFLFVLTRLRLIRFSAGRGEDSFLDGLCKAPSAALFFALLLAPRPLTIPPPA
jgi:hypothetical protein